MEITLIRHGMTAGNLERRYIGRTDDPLCDRGVEHARRTGSDDRVTRLYVSPLARTRQTAEIKFPNAEAVICDDLQEMDFGDFENKTADEMADDDAYRLWLDSNCTLPCPGGEQMDAFADRVCRAFDKIVSQAVEKGDDRVVVVTHGGCIMSIMTRYARPARAHYYEWYVDNCCGYRARLSPEQWARDPALTDYAHFETLGSTQAETEASHIPLPGAN